MVQAIHDGVERQALSVDQAAHALGCGRVSVYKLIKEGQLRRVKIGARTVIPRNEIDRFLGGNDNRAA